MLLVFASKVEKKEKEKRERREEGKEERRKLSIVIPFAHSQGLHFAFKIIDSTREMIATLYTIAILLTLSPSLSLSLKVREKSEREMGGGKKFKLNFSARGARNKRRKFCESCINSVVAIVFRLAAIFLSPPKVHVRAYIRMCIEKV